MSRAIEAFLNGRLLAGLGAAIVLSVLLTPLLARRLRITRPAAYLSALAGLLIISFTIFERLEGLPGFDPGRALTWWTEIRQSPIEVARTEPAWRLNVALFVPAGVIWSVVTKRPLAVAAALFGFSFGIATLQTLTWFLMRLNQRPARPKAASARNGLLGLSAQRCSRSALCVAAYRPRS